MKVTYRIVPDIPTADNRMGTAETFHHFDDAADFAEVLEARNKTSYHIEAESDLHIGMRVLDGFCIPRRVLGTVAAIRGDEAFIKWDKGPEDWSQIAILLPAEELGRVEA